MKNNILNQNSEKLSEKKLDWTVIQTEMKNKFGNDIFESWIKKIEFVNEFNDYVLISVSTRFIRDWITSRYLDQILQLIKSYKSSINRIEFTIKEIKENNITNNKYQTIHEKNLEDNSNISFIKDSYLQYNRIDPNKKFENFILGLCNKIAYEASHKMSQEVSHYNPLYIYGGVGMGKTHLLNAIGLNLKDKKSKVMFISAERFMYQFVRSIKLNEMVKFKDYFRNTDVLLIDDIQFMNGKEAMQEEFFHTFNALFDRGSKIIISADRSPNKLSRIQERIKSRFSGGLVVDIQSPEYELRHKIIKTKFEELRIFHKDQVKISEEIQKFISSEVKSNIRELVGALNRIVSYSRIYDKSPSIAEVKVILKDLLNINENKVTIDLIQSIVCKFFKISKNEMLSSRRSRYLVRPRQTAIYLTKILTPKSLPEIGREFSNRDHTTIIHSIKTIEKLKNNDGELNNNIEKLKNQILYNKENEV
jgi:chromosomal replication initiator protein